MVSQKSRVPMKVPCTPRCSLKIREKGALKKKRKGGGKESQREGETTKRSRGGKR